MTKIKCLKCRYEWNTNSKMLWVTCPSCRLKAKNYTNTTLTEGDLVEIKKVIVK